MVEEDAVVYGISAEFRTAEELTDAVKAARAAGYTRLDAFSPFPLREVAKELDVKTWLVPVVGLAAGAVGAAVQYLAQYWMNVVDYPINVGGRPLHSVPPFLVGPLIVSFLWAAIAIFLVFIFKTGLPRLNHPVFSVQGFERASENAFFLCILAEDPQFDARETATFLGGLQVVSVREVRA